jgi:hypothetical protein
MKALLNRAKVALLMKILTILERVSRQIRAKVGVDYAIRGSIVANRSRSIPRPPMVFVNRSFAHTHRLPSRRNVPQPIEFDSDDLSNTDSQ